MEPNSEPEKSQEPEIDKEQEKANKKAINDLHAEGVDIMAEPNSGNQNESTASSANIYSANTDQTNTSSENSDTVKNEQTSSYQNEIDSFLGNNTPQTPKEKIEILGKNNPSIKPLRTFKTDAEEAIYYQNMSASKIAIAEQEKRQREEIQAVKVAKIAEENNLNNPQSSSKIIILIIVLILLIGGGVGAYLFKDKIKDILNKSAAENTKPKPAPQKKLNIKTLIPYNQADIIDITDISKPLDNIAIKLSEKESAQGEIIALIPILNGSTTKSAMFSDIIKNISMPDKLERSFEGENYMLGSYGLGGFNKSPFIIVKNNFFQNAFSGMLEWEKSMRNDIISWVKINNKDIKKLESGSDIFQDLIISNVDTRILKSEDGNEILLYGFVDKDTLIITTKKETMAFLISKLLAIRVVQ